MPSRYFAQVIESAHPRETMEKSLLALRLELAPDIADHHTQTVYAAIDRLETALARIILDDGSIEDMRRIAQEALA